MAGLYIHIPFCHSKCIYCDFYSVPGKKYIDEVVKGIIEEYGHRKNEILQPFKTIYIGGGTPSILPPNYISLLLNSLPVQDAMEITMEANPEDITSENVRLWKDLGINRVSMGAQSLDDSILRSLGRRHTSSQALHAVDIIIDGGITNVSVDMIYALPGLTVSEWDNQLKEIMSLPITHLSAYCLTYHENTFLEKMRQQGKITPIPDDEVAVQFDILRRRCSDAGFEHYEISNMARPGYRSVHNSSYWNPSSSWIGLGPSAHSFDGRTRRIDFSDTHKWLNALPSPFYIEEESPLDIVNDNIVTALRTLEGLDITTVPTNYHEDLLGDAQKFISDGRMTFDGRFLAIKPEQWLISDLFIRELLR